MTAALVVLGGYLLGSMPFGYWVDPALQGRGHPQGRQRQHRRHERLARVRTLVRDPDRAARRGEGVRAGARRDAARRRAGRRARGRGGDARALAAAVPPLPEGREDGGHRGRDVLRRRDDARPDRARDLDRHLSRHALCVARLDRDRALAAVRRARARGAVAGDRLRVDRCGRRRPPPQGEHRAPPGGHREPLRAQARAAPPQKSVPEPSVAPSQSASEVCRSVGSAVPSSARSSPTVPSRSASTSCAWIVSKLTWRA